MALPVAVQKGLTRRSASGRLHHLVHLLFGVAGLLMARTPPRPGTSSSTVASSTSCCGLFGHFVGDDSPANFVPVNNADNWLHLVLGLGMIVQALLLSRSTDRSQSPTR
ncbi:DUF4383 domain-containing protein [Arthrobacter sp. U41]|uniref:DUF4383 domain-containing protein n=1 Tax=Arthrobacter sp. U41 TaxID=1849032 RepID=UPI0011A29E32